MADIKLYGAPWCPDCKRSKKFLAEHRVVFDWIDIDEDAEARRYVEDLQRGGRSIPTIVFPDGSYLIEPADDELARKLGMKLEASRSFYDVAIVGGGPTGLAAALYAAREGIDAVVIDKSALGGQAAITERIDNYPGFPGWRRWRRAHGALRGPGPPLRRRARPGPRGERARDRRHEHRPSSRQ